MRSFGVLLAGGLGSRMKRAKLPKQFLELEGVPVIVLTLRRMAEVEEFDAIVIAIHPDWKEYLEELLGSSDIDRGRIVITEGGSERIDTIRNAMSCVEGHFDVGDGDVIVFHDAVRPFISPDVLRASIRAAAEHGGAVASYPAADTMYLSEDGKLVSSMPDRRKLYHGQAPDSFLFTRFKRALESLSAEERRAVTGTAQIGMLKGIPICLVPSDSSNMKITSDSDIAIATSIMKSEWTAG
jgi:2-C-methyl-D-erythritol 4-phosphate cytidylyltransferase